MKDANDSSRCPRSPLALMAVCTALLGGAPAVLASPAFEYDPITDPIISATFSIDFAAMNAHRAIGEFEVNFVELIDVNSGLGVLELSDDLFGTAALPDDPPALDMGVLATGIISAPINAPFFPALASGSVGLRALLTDTVDAMFAMDFIALTIETGRGTVESYYGWPVGDENNGFGIGLLDGEDLPDGLPASILEGATGTGFDETISSKSIYAIPEPTSAALMLAAGLLVCRRRDRR